jgi:predicted transposase YbfD/YdcC
MAASSVGSIKRHFRRLMDLRVKGRTRHLLVDVIVMAICGGIANCNGWRDIAMFAKARESWFKRFLRLPNGAPAHDTFERVFNMLNPRAFQICFTNWVKEISDLVGLRHIAIDGKSLCHSYQHGKGLGMLHSVSAWAAEQHLSLGEVMTDAKSNEITAIPKLLELLDLHGALVTIDAMGCQKEIAKEIVKRGGDYVLAVKGNQPHLLEDIQATVEKAMDGLLPEEQVETYTKVESNQGKKEERSYVVINNVEQIRDVDQWENLKTVGICRTDRTANGETKTEVRYFIGSKKMSARKYGKAMRGHWGIENNLHWQLDVSFEEDKSTIHRRNAGANMAGLRRMALSLLAQHPSNESMPRKRKLAALDSEFLAEVVTQSYKERKV